MVTQRDSQLSFHHFKTNRRVASNLNSLTLRRARFAFKIAAAFARAVPFCNFDAGPVGFFAATGFFTVALGFGLVPTAFLMGLPSLPFAGAFLTAGFLAGAAFLAGAGFADAGFFAVSAFFAGSGFFAAGFAAGLSVFFAVDEPAAAAAGFFSLSAAKTRRARELDWKNSHTNVQ